MPRTSATPPPRGVYEHPKGSGVWWIHYHLDGKRHREKVGNKSDAINLYQTRKTDHRRGVKLPELSRNKVMFGTLLDKAIEYGNTHSKHPADYSIKAEIIRPDLGDVPAINIKPDTIIAWLTGRKLSNATFNRYKTFFSVCFREGIAAGLVDANPSRIIRRRRESTGRKRFLSAEEYERLLAYLTERSQKQADAFYLSVNSGMRKNEQFTAEWSQINFTRNVIHLTETKNGDDRDIPMTPGVRELLLRMHDEAQPQPEDLVFTRPNGGTKEVVTPWLDNACETLGIFDYTWHNNRHTFCSWHAINGTPLITIKELAGHRSIATTMRYAHLSPDAKQHSMQTFAPPKPATATKTATTAKRPSKLKLENAA
jgi:integrase